MPTHVLVGEAMPARRAAIYARLIEGGVIPPITPLPGDSALAFLERAVAAVPNVPSFTVTLGVQRDGYTEHDRRRFVGPAQVLVTFEASPDDVVYADLTAFDERLRGLDAPLAGALVAAFDRGSHPLHCVSPVSAWELAYVGTFHGDAQAWWEELREELSDQEPRARKRPLVTNAQIRKHLRESGMDTPGALRRRLGRHYCEPDRLAPRTLARRIAALPTPVRWAALALHESTRRLRRIGRALDNLIGPAERAVWEVLPDFPHPALILDSVAVGETTAVGEILEERYNWDMQDQGWGPAFVLVLEDAPASVERLRKALALMAAASTVARELGDALAGFEQLTVEERACG